MEKKILSIKDMYLTAALRLFAEKGYDGVGVAEIANSIGCTTSALYKHYDGKRALFDALLKYGREAYQQRMEQVTHTESKSEQSGCMTEEEQIAMMHTELETALDDEEGALFRKLLTVEQFKHQEFAQTLNETYLYGPVQAYEKLMRMWIDAGMLREGDARMMAIQYAAPISVLIGVCDRQPERRQEMLALLTEHVRQFNRAYRIR